MKIKASIQGSSPLLVNRFTEEEAAKVSAGTSTSIKSGARGTPREQAEPKLYLSANGQPMMPGPNIYSAIIAAGSFHKAGKTKITTARSSLVCAAMMVDDIECMLLDPFKGGPAAWEVDSRSVVIPATGGRVMRHRPRFDAWKLDFQIDSNGMFDDSLIRALVDDAGSKVGLGDYRPSRKGPFGRYLVTHWEVIKDTIEEPKSKSKTKAA